MLVESVFFSSINCKPDEQSLVKDSRQTSYKTVDSLLVEKNPIGHLYAVI